MKGKIFEDKIKSLMEQVEKLCREENIEFLAQFNMDNNMNNNEFYYYANGHALLDTSTLISQIQLLEIRKGIRL